MNHYCTYFDRIYLTHGVALWNSIQQHDPGAVLWVLTLDDTTAVVMRGLRQEDLRVVTLAELEAGDAALAAAKANRSRVEYYFTLSPCWPDWLLRTRSEIPAITYLDADLYFWSSPAPIFTEIEAAGASVGITAHRYSPGLEALKVWGSYNVGIQYFRNDEAGRAVVADWRARCLDWCYDRYEPDRFADQKYLDAWPERFGRAVHVVAHPGVNVAPWNWRGLRWGGSAVLPTVDGRPLVVFHYAKFRLLGSGIWDSGQLEFSVMPRGRRVRLYEPYWQALHAAARTTGMTAPSATRGARVGWRKWVMRALFGPAWWRAGGCWIALGLGPLGRYGGALMLARRGKKYP